MLKKILMDASGILLVFIVVIFASGCSVEKEAHEHRTQTGTTALHANAPTPETVVTATLEPVIETPGSGEGGITPTPTPDGYKVFKVVSDFDEIEVEEAPLVDAWAAETDLSGFSGVCYYTWRGADCFNNPGEGILTYMIEIPTAGTYYFSLHNRHDFHDGTEENDVFARMDDGNWMKLFSWERGVWTWASQFDRGNGWHPPASYKLSAGVHTFQLSARSKGFSIDEIGISSVAPTPIP